MSRRGLRPSEAIKFKELGYSREEIEIYLQSGFHDVDDWLNAGKIGIIDPEEYRDYKRSGFSNYDDFKNAIAAGFENKDEYDEAREGGFPDRATWIIGKEEGFSSYVDYKKHLSNQSTTSFSSNEEIPNEQEKASFSVKESASINSFLTTDLRQEFQPDIENEPSAPMSYSDQGIETKIPSTEEEKTPLTAIIPDRLKLLAIQELKAKYPLPQIKPSEFFDNPELERVYRFAEVLEQTIQVNLDDFTNALSFIDVYDLEEWLQQDFESHYYQINYDKHEIVFHPDIYPLVIKKIDE
ncbi:MAG: hypothetical protein ACFFD1_08070, partial [Candidatus Thorarchaeota archaeon]